nr:hypothetical protein [Tanacetum cinerariifolium]
MFDINTLTMSMNYQPVFTENQTNGNADTKANFNAGQTGKKAFPGPQYVLLSLLTTNSQGPKSSEDEVADDVGKKSTKVLRKENGVQDQQKKETANTNKTNRLNTVSSPVNVVSSSFTTVDPGRERAQMNEFKNVFGQDKDANDNSTYMMFNPVSAAGSSYDTRMFSGAYDDEVEGADFNNLELITVVSPISTTKIHKDHPKEQIIEDPLSALQTRRMTKTSQDHVMDTVDLQDTRMFSDAYDDEVEGANFNNLELITVVNPISTTKIHKDHPKEQIIEDPLSSLQTRRMTKTSQEHGRERAQMNEFENVFGQDKDANDNSTYRMFNPVSAAGSSYVNLSGSVPVNAA